MPAPDPSLTYVLGTPFEADFGTDPNAPPAPPATTRLVPEFGEMDATNPFSVPFTLHAHDPAIAVPPSQVLLVIVPKPVPADADVAFFMDDSKGFPTGVVTTPIPDPAQDTAFTLAIAPPAAPIYGGVSYQPIYGYPAS